MIVSMIQGFDIHLFKIHHFAVDFTIQIFNINFRVILKYGLLIKIINQERWKIE